MQLKERVCRREMEGGHWSLKLDFLLPLPALALWNRLSSFAGWCVVSTDSPQCGEHDCDEPTSNWSFSRELLSCQATRKGCKQRPASFDFFFSISIRQNCDQSNACDAGRTMAMESE